MEVLALIFIFFLWVIWCLIKDPKFWQLIIVSLLKRKREKSVEVIEYRPVDIEPDIQIRSSAPNNRSRYSTSKAKAAIDEKWERRREDPVLQKYGDMLNKHIMLQREIDKEYSAATFESKDFFSPRMEHVVDLCQQDILLAEQYRQYLNELRRAPTPHEKVFSTFRRLAIIYEKRKDYEGSIAVCEYANEIGFFFEDTNNTFEKRLSRLQGKLLKASGGQLLPPAPEPEPVEPSVDDSPGTVEPSVDDSPSTQNAD